MSRLRMNARPQKLPPHPGQVLMFENFQGGNFKLGRGLPDSFNYIAPTPKYAPAQFQPGPVYYGGEAASIGNQPWNFSQVWTAYSTPKQMDWAYKKAYRGTQSAASFALAQQSMAQLLALRSINSGG